MTASRTLPPAFVPWNRQQLVVLAAANAAACALLLAAWSGSSDEADLAAQVPWLNLGVLAVVVSSGVDLLWLATGRSRVRSRRRAALADPSPIGPADTGQPNATSLVRLARGRRIHRSDCPLARGKAASPVVERQATDPPCEVCRP